MAKTITVEFTYEQAKALETVVAMVGNAVAGSELLPVRRQLVDFISDTEIEIAQSESRNEK